MLTQNERHLLPNCKTGDLPTLPTQAEAILYSDFNVIEWCGRPLAVGRPTL